MNIKNKATKTLAGLVLFATINGCAILDPYYEAVKKVHSAPTIETKVPEDKVYLRFQEEAVMHGKPTYYAFIEELYKRNEGNIIQPGKQRHQFYFKSQPINWPDVDCDGFAGNAR
jgi:hypothetical protein